MESETNNAMNIIKDKRIWVMRAEPKVSAKLDIPNFALSPPFL